MLICLPFYLRMALLDQWQQCMLQVTQRQLWEVWFVEITSCQREMLFYNFQYSVNFAGSSFDPLGQARGPAPPLEMKNSDGFVLFCIKLFQSINSNKNPSQGQSLKTSRQLRNLEDPNSKLCGIIAQTFIDVISWLARAVALAYNNVWFQWFLVLTVAQQPGCSCCHTDAVTLAWHCRGVWKSVWQARSTMVHAALREELGGIFPPLFHCALWH